MDIAHWRQEIDLLETQLIQTLNQRARFAIEIGEIKRQEGMKVYDAARENEILDRVARKNDGPLSNEALQSVFKQIIQVTRSLEEEHHSQGHSKKSNEGN